MIIINECADGALVLLHGNLHVRFPLPGADVGLHCICPISEADGRPALYDAEALSSLCQEQAQAIREHIGRWDPGKPFGYLIATDMLVSESGREIRYMYRESPANPMDSGWRVFCGDEPYGYADRPENLGIYDLSTILSVDGRIAPCLSLPVGVYIDREDEKTYYDEVMNHLRRHMSPSQAEALYGQFCSNMDILREFYYALRNSKVPELGVQIAGWSAFRLRSELDMDFLSAYNTMLLLRMNEEHTIDELAELSERRGKDTHD